MSQSGPLIQTLADCEDKSLVGGKAINLGALIRAGFPVPGGFVVTTSAYRLARQHQGIPAELAEQISRAYQHLGSGPVAVRSSATAEDLSEASMAGQYETFLDITGEQSLLEAIHKCWASLDSPRTRTYLAEHGIDLSQVAMAVVVQRLVPADVAGVLFCANPRTGSRSEMLIEASWGLGESVVSGRVQPDVLKIDTATGQVLHSRIADKQLCIRPGDHAESPVEESLRTVPCLRDADVSKLWKLGRQATEHFGSPQDIEWALHEGELFLLQSRPITTLAGAEAYEHVLQSTRQHLLDLLDHGHGPWVLHNLAETLSHPTPLTWSVIQRFMSGTGGFGAMYKLAGFEPSPKVAAEGFLHRLAGKVYMDLSLAAEMFFADYPYHYDLDELRRNPDAAQSPPTIPAGSLGARAAIGRRITRINRNLHSLAQDLDQRLRQEIIPSFEAWCRQEKQRNLSELPADQLISLWQQRQVHIMDEFAPQSLLPSLILAMALADLRSFLDEQFWDDEPDALASMLSSGHAPDKTITANAHLREVAMGTRRLEDWLAEYGHRAPDEFDLATPRWRERPDELRAMANRLKDGADPLHLHEERQQRTREKLEELRSQLNSRDRKELDARLDLVWRYLPFREDGKYYLMLGYDLLRDVALEAGRRLGIGDDVFQLSLEELHAALDARAKQQHLIDQRKVAYEAERRITLPRIIDRESIGTFGEAPAVHVAGSHSAYPVSTGTAMGPARIVRSPQEAGDLGSGYVLVCPSTDPGWTPLFVNAAGLILECGGTLSHGAVIAREMNIPAVVLAGATELFKDGEIISVDGRNGLVTRAGGREGAGAALRSAPAWGESGQEAANPDDVHIPRSLVPPVPGRRERASATLRNITGLIWGIYLIAAYTLPTSWLWRPSLRVLDWILWPMVRALGKPAAVAIVSASLAALTMIVQKWLTDNPRLLEGKRRSRLLLKEAAKLPKRCKRRYAVEALAAGVQMRVALAAFVPLAVLLGPMVMTFAWFPERVDPSAWNAEPGTALSVVATIDGDWPEPVSLEIAPPLTMDEQPTRALPPIRQTLDRLADQLQKTGQLPSDLPDLQAAGFKSPADALADLNSYLKNGLPSQNLSWKIRPDEGAAGRFPVTLKTKGSPPLSLNVVLGEAYPPQVCEIVGSSKSPLRSLKVTYDPSQQKRVFWMPLAKLGWSRWEAGWLTVYVLAYLPVTFGLKWLLRVA